MSFLLKASWNLRVLNLVAVGSFSGSAVYTPSTRVPFNMASALISTARRAEAVSVVKNGLPLPPPMMTTLPSFIASMARRRLISLQMGSMAKPLSNSVRSPCFSSSACSAILLMSVASIPI